MNIKTKFSLGDTVFTIREVHIVSFEIKGISIDFGKDNNVVVCYRDDKYNTYRDNNCFGSPQQLLEHLTGEGK